VKAATILQDVTENDDFVQDDKKGQKDCGFCALSFAYLVQKVLLEVFLFKL